MVDRANPNRTFDRTAGSPALASAGQRGRSPHWRVGRGGCGRYGDRRRVFGDGQPTRHGPSGRGIAVIRARGVAVSRPSGEFWAWFPVIR